MLNLIRQPRFSNLCMIILISLFIFLIFIVIWDVAAKVQRSDISICMPSFY